MELNPQKFNEAVKNLYAAALSETIELLKNNKNGSFIALPDSDWVGAEIDDGDEYVGTAIWAVGVKDDGELYVKARVDEGEYAPDLENEWINAENIKEEAYPDIYRFVAQYLDEAVSEEEADEVEPGDGYVLDL